NQCRALRRRQARNRHPGSGCAERLRGCGSGICYQLPQSGNRYSSRRGHRGALYYFGTCVSGVVAVPRGQGVATGVGAFLALAPRAVLVVLAIFFVIVAIFRYVSLGSIVASAIFPVLAF